MTNFVVLCHMKLICSGRFTPDSPKPDAMKRDVGRWPAPCSRRR